MFAKMKTLTLSLAIGMSALAVAPALAQDWGDDYVRRDRGRTVIIDPSVTIDADEDRDYRRDRRERNRTVIIDEPQVTIEVDRRDRRDRRDRDRRFDRDDYRACSPDRAVSKARRMGLRDARVVDVGRRSITVRGRSYGDRVRITFGRSPSCPVIGRF